MSAIEVAGLDHIVLRVKDLEKSIAWYRSVLGGRVERLLPGMGLVQMRLGASLIDLVDVGGPVGKAGGAAPGVKRRNLEHFCVQLTEFDERRISAHLKRKGVVAGPTARRYGALGHGPSMYLTDRDGNTVELKGPPEADQTEHVENAIWPGRRRAKSLERWRG